MFQIDNVCRVERPRTGVGINLDIQSVARKRSRGDKSRAIAADFPNTNPVIGDSLPICWGGGESLWFQNNRKGPQEKA